MIFKHFLKFLRVAGAESSFGLSSAANPLNLMGTEIMYD